MLLYGARLFEAQMKEVIQEWHINYCSVRFPSCKFFPVIQSILVKILGTFLPLVSSISSRVLARVVQRLDNAIHRINHYPVDKC